MSIYDFFRAPGTQSYFDDSGGNITKIDQVATFASSSINTSDVDVYRQGIEITSWPHFNAGIVKIHAGEPGHLYKRTCFGLGGGTSLSSDERYVEESRVDPVVLLSSSIVPALVVTNHIALPITALLNSRDRTLFDGVIEPLTIRTTPSSIASGIPFIDNAHVVRGYIAGGNTGRDNGSDMAMTRYRYDVQHPTCPFVDTETSAISLGSQEIGVQRTTTVVQLYVASSSFVAPFADARYVRNTLTSSAYDQGVEVALSAMTGSTDNYVSTLTFKISAAAGWTYDSVQGIGTDSLAFAGMEH